MRIYAVKGGHASLIGPTGPYRELEVCARGMTNLPGWKNLRLVQSEINATSVTLEFSGDPPPPPPSGGVITPVAENVFAGKLLAVPKTVQNVVIRSESNSITVAVESGPVAFADDGDIGIFPLPGTPITVLPMPPFPGLKDGMRLTEPPPGYSQQLGSGEYLVWRMNNSIRIFARGTLNYAYEFADLRIHTRAWPPRFAMWAYAPDPPPMASAVTRTFSFPCDFTFPPDVNTVVITDADGDHVVDILSPVKATSLAKAGSATEIGYGGSLELAVESAIAAFQEVHEPDRIYRYDVVGDGKLIGGFVGMNTWFAEVKRT